jgi:DNA-binding LacI/PurR family transcriptional regulator
MQFSRPATGWRWLFISWCKRGIRIPDISSSVSTNLPAAEIRNPPLSTVTQPAIQEIGHTPSGWIELIERSKLAPAIVSYPPR